MNQGNLIIGALALALLGGYYASYQSNYHNKRIRTIGEIPANIPPINILFFIWSTYISDIKWISEIIKSIYHSINILFTIGFGTLLFTFEMQSATGGSDLGVLKDWAVGPLSILVALTASSVIGSLTGGAHAVTVGGINYVQEQEKYWTKSRIISNIILIISLVISGGITGFLSEPIQELDIVSPIVDLAYSFTFSFLIMLVLLSKLFGKYCEANINQPQGDSLNDRDQRGKHNNSHTTGIKRPIGSESPSSTDDSTDIQESE